MFWDSCSRSESLSDEVASNIPAVRHADGNAMQCEMDFFSALLQNAP